MYGITFFNFIKAFFNISLRIHRLRIVKTLKCINTKVQNRKQGIKDRKVAIKFCSLTSIRIMRTKKMYNPSC